MIKDVVYGQKYQKDGEEKVAWKKAGTLFIKDGKITGIKLDMIPTGEWDGFLNVFDPKPRSETSAPAPSEETTDIEPF